ncbi:MAG: hypothetical protein QM576_10175 [Rhodopseudomonas sp.]
MFGYDDVAVKEFRAEHHTPNEQNEGGKQQGGKGTLMRHAQKLK